MSDIPSELKFLASHEWARLCDNGELEIGISDHAQEALGELVYVELPGVGDKLDAGEESAVVESVKAASDVYCPASGTVTAINEELEERPDLVNDSPYSAGWLFRLKPELDSDYANMLDAAEYEETLEDED
ncbi:MAG: glycine cleavage system protein GcvH [Gammaproteobacteria bacterium]